MKMLLLMALVFSNQSVFAENLQERYCGETSKRILYVDVSLTSNIPHLNIQEGELIATLGNGKSVVVPCSGKYGDLKNNTINESFIINSKNVFVLERKNRISNGKRIMGYNDREGTSLLKEHKYYVVSKYSIVSNDQLAQK